MTTLLVDAGPLVALLNDRERNHAWARELFGSLKPPLVTCEPVLTEASHLLRSSSRAQGALLELLGRNVLTCEFRVSAELAPIRSLMQKFADIPMSLADACLVRMSEIDPQSVVITLDGDFRVYRRNRRQIVPVLMPDGG